MCAACLLCAVLCCAVLFVRVFVCVCACLSACLRLHAAFGICAPRQPLCFFPTHSCYDFCPPSPPEQVAYLLNGVGSLLRAVSMLDPLSTLGYYPLVVSSVVLMRLPQMCWVLAIANLAVIWNYVARCVVSSV